LTKNGLVFNPAGALVLWFSLTDEIIHIAQSGKHVSCSVITSFEYLKNLPVTKDHRNHPKSHTTKTNNGSSLDHRWNHDWNNPKNSEKT
jgi:hypothetical protein